LNSGIVLSLAAYVCWGLLPMYLHLVRQAGAVEVVCHRIVWSCVLLTAYLLVTGRAGKLLAKLDRPMLARYATAAVLISLNWGAYIWGVEHERVLEVSLGYFIMPLVAVLLGRLYLGERLSRLQSAGVAIATAGVVFLCLRSQSIPWISFILAITFSLYSLVKKQATLPAGEGLALETLVIVLPALALMGWMDWRGNLTFLHQSAAMDALLAGTGIATIVPLLLFAAAVHRVELSLIGMLQYVTPTLQFLVGYFVLSEPLPGVRLWGFAVIWTGLAVYLYDMARKARQQARHPTCTPPESHA